VSAAQSSTPPIPPPLAWVGSNICPVCRIDHQGANCAKFWEAYRDHNAAGLAKYEKQSRPAFRVDERAALLLRTRTILSQCDSRDKMLAALDELIRTAQAGGAF
jgi:hypothetical protein